MTKAKVRVLALAAVMTLLLALPALVSAQSAPPHVFIGKATVNGVPAQAGTMVMAMVGDRMVGEAVVQGAAGEFKNLQAIGSSLSLIHI